MKSLVFILAAVLLLIPAALYAIEDPDNGPLIERALAYESVLEDGDLLVIVLYRVDYDILPVESIAVTYAGRFLRGGDELRATEIFPFNNRGYGLGVFSFYWTPIEREADSVEFGNPNAEDYIIRFQGLPSAFPGTPPSISFTNITYQDASDLRDDIIDLANALERDAGWSANNVDLISESGGEIRLTAQGGEYFANAVRNLSAMGTELFSSNLTNPSFSEREFDFTEANRLERFLDDSPIGDGFDALGGLFGVGSVFAKAAVAIILMISIAGVGTRMAQAFGADNAGLFGALTVGPMLAILARIGLLTLETAALAAFLSFAAIVFLVLLQRSQ